MQRSTRIAVADLGTNSTRLLVADVTAAGLLEQLEHRTVVTRLGEGVDRSGRLADAALARVHECLADYREIADHLGAERSIAVATSAVRDADNGEHFREEVRARHGFDIRVISGEQEARLTFLGATTGRSESGQTLVIDIGGGSTEFVVGAPASSPSFHVSTRLGSVRQSERHLLEDPPSGESLAALAGAAAEIVAEGVPVEVREAVTSGIAVAGTATTLAAIDQGLDPYSASRVHGYRLPIGACERMLAMLSGKPIAERRHVAGLHPDRAPTIVAGAAILVESMRLFELDEVETSEADILHGAALDAITPG